MAGTRGTYRLRVKTASVVYDAGRFSQGFCCRACGDGWRSTLSSVRKKLKAPATSIAAMNTANTYRNARREFRSFANKRLS
jgi:hypothetical protein